jgi:hypothetical protein
MKEELIKRIENYCQKWNGKEITLMDIVEINGEQCQLLTDIYRYLKSL